MAFYGQKNSADFNNLQYVVNIVPRFVRLMEKDFGKRI